MHPDSDLFGAIPSNQETPSKVLLSISTLALELGAARETIRNRITEAGIEPAGHGRGGHPLYRLKDVLEAWYAAMSNPDRMQPAAKLAHFKAEAERVKLDTLRGQLIRREDFEAEVSRILQIIVQELELMPDRIEMDMSVPKETVEEIEERINEARERIADRISDVIQECDAQNASTETEVLPE